MKRHLEKMFAGSSQFLIPESVLLDKSPLILTRHLRQFLCFVRIAF